MASLFDSIRNTGNAAAQKAQDIAEQTKLNGELGKLRDQRQAMFAQLGQMFYDSKKNNTGEPDYAQLIAAIDDVNANTRAIEERIAILKGGSICPSCKQIVPSGNRFCPSCGTEMPLPQPETPQAGGAACANCGAPLAPGAKFCAKCGTPAAPAAPAPAPVPEVVADVTDTVQEAAEVVQEAVETVQEAAGAGE